MDKQHFDKLVKGVCEMKRHMAGKDGDIFRVGLTRFRLGSAKDQRVATAAAAAIAKAKQF